MINFIAAAHDRCSFWRDEDIGQAKSGAVQRRSKYWPGKRHNGAKAHNAEHGCAH